MMEVSLSDDEIDSEGRRDTVLVMPGEVITKEQGFLRGHGTYIGKDYTHRLEVSKPKREGEKVDTDEEEEEGYENSDKCLLASVAGIVMRVNKLISVVPVRCRYSGDVGDIVVGRIIEVGNKTWKVDVRARQNAILQLGSINLPGGALRRRTLEDQLQMRSLFKENDLISAEVASFYQDGGMAIHTRSLRYGKLENGQLVTVPPSLIKRVKQHFVTLPCGVDLLLAHNGNIWLSIEGEERAKLNTEQSRMSEEMELRKRVHRERVYSVEERLRIARVRNSILVLVETFNHIYPDSITRVYNRSISERLEVKAMLTPLQSHKWYE